MPGTRRTRDELLVYKDPDPLLRYETMQQGMQRNDMPPLSPENPGYDPSIYNLADQQHALRAALDSVGRLETGLDQVQNGSKSPPTRGMDFGSVVRQPQQQTEPGFMQDLGRIGGAVGDDLSRLGAGAMRGLDAITPSADTMRSLFAGLEGGAAAMQGRTPLWAQLRQQNMNYAGQQQEMEQRRAQMAQQLQMKQQERLQKLDDQALKIWGDHQMPVAMRKKLSEQLGAQGSTLAQNLVRLGDDQIVGELDSLRPYLKDGDVERAIQVMKTPNADLTPIELMVGSARERKKAYGENVHKSERFSELLKLDQEHGIENTPYAKEFIDIVNELSTQRNKLQESRLKLQEMGLGNQLKANQLAGSNVDLAAKQVLPQAGPELQVEGGNTERQVYYPATGEYRTVKGTKPPLVQMGPEQTEFDKGLGREGAQAYTGLQKAARIAIDKRSRLDMMSKMLDGIETGRGEPTIMEMKKLANTFLPGSALKSLVDIDKLAPQEAFQSLTNAFALELRNTAEGSGMPGNMSDADREFLVDQAPTLSKTKGGNRLVIEVWKRRAQRDIDVAKLADDFRIKHGSLTPKDKPSFESHLRNWSEQHPLFQDMPGYATKKKSQQSSGDDKEFDALMKKYGG